MMIKGYANINQTYVETWHHLVSHCDAKMSAIQNLWFDLYSKYDPVFLDTYLPYVVTLFSYVIFNLPFLIVDIYGCPKFLLKYKVQPNQNVPVSPKLLKKAAGTIAFNLIVVGFILTYIFSYLRRWRGCPIGPQLPTIFEIFRDLVVIVICEEIGFYYSHRFLHSSYMYKRIHKRHHEWTAPISVISVYCHPFEHVLANNLPVLIGPLLCGAHTVTTSLWFILSLYVTTCHHSGYKFPFTPSPSFHDFHHEKFTQNFGAIGLLDYLHGTDVTYRERMKLKKK